jgi:hypothetical protein
MQLANTELVNTPLTLASQRGEHQHRSPRQHRCYLGVTAVGSQLASTLTPHGNRLLRVSTASLRNEHAPWPLRSVAAAEAVLGRLWPSGSRASSWHSGRPSGCGGLPAILPYVWSPLRMYALKRLKALGTSRVTRSQASAPAENSSANTHAPSQRSTTSTAAAKHLPHQAQPVKDGEAPAQPKPEPLPPPTRAGRQRV